MVFPRTQYSKRMLSSSIHSWAQLPKEAVSAPSIPGGDQSLVGWGPGQPEVVGGWPARSRGRTGWSLRPLPKPLYDSVKFTGSFVCSYYKKASSFVQGPYNSLHSWEASTTDPSQDQPFFPGNSCWKKYTVMVSDVCLLRMGSPMYVSRAICKLLVKRSASFFNVSYTGI